MPSKTINMFCQRQAISRSTYYKLKKLGKGPRTHTVLGVERISDEAERDWEKAGEEAETRKAEAKGDQRIRERDTESTA